VLPITITILVLPVDNIVQFTQQEQ